MDFRAFGLKMAPTRAGFIGDASTYQDVGYASFRAHAWLDRIECPREPTVVYGTSLDLDSECNQD